MTACELYGIGTDFLYVLLVNVSLQRVNIGFLASLEGMNIRMKPYYKQFSFQYPASTNLHPACSINL